MDETNNLEALESDRQRCRCWMPAHLRRGKECPVHPPDKSDDGRSLGLGWEGGKDDWDPFGGER